MGWWFGRKSAPADARPYVPAWLTDSSQEEGFARSTAGMSAYVKAAGVSAEYHDGTWEIGTLRGASVVLGGVQVIGGRLAGIPAPSGGTNVDVEGRAAIGRILAALRQHGLIES